MSNGDSGNFDGVMEVKVPYKWLPRHGEPSTKLETMMQRAVKIVAFLPVYTAIVVTLTLLVLIFGVPFAGGSR